jgi:hypothetical protein
MSTDSFKKPQIELVVFTNNKRSSDKAPIETGTITFNEEFHFSPGDKLDVAIWNRMSKKGNSFKSGLAKLPDPKFAKPAYNNASQSSGVEMVDF